MAVTILLEMLSPGTSLKDMKLRGQWLKNVQTAKPVVDSCLEMTFPGVIRNALCQANRLSINIINSCHTSDYVTYFLLWGTEMPGPSVLLLSCSLNTPIVLFKIHLSERQLFGYIRLSTTHDSNRSCEYTMNCF